MKISIVREREIIICLEFPPKNNLPNRTSGAAFLYIKCIILRDKAISVIVSLFDLQEI